MIYFLREIPEEVGGMLTTGDLREVFGELLHETLIDEFAVEFGVVERERKIDIRAFVRSLVIGAETPDGGLQADALRAYLDMNVPDISRAAFYKRFDEALEKLMDALTRHAMMYAARLEVDLPGILGGVTEWYIYRVRWDVELSMKLDKTIQRIDQTKATKAATIKTMLHAGLLASNITTTLLHRHHLATRSKKGANRKVARRRSARLT
jgi:hypothetical protein